MPLPVFSTSDYLQQFLRLLPRGRVWRRGITYVMHADLWTLMPTWSRLHLRLNALIGEIFPCSTQELLPEWESSLGLPDPCTGPLGTIQARQRAVCQKFSARGGQSKAYFIAVARALGFNITITEFAPFVAGGNRAGDALYGEAWAYAWRVSSSSSDVFAFRAGQSTASEPLRSWGDRLLECVLRAIAPAHTILQFAYGGITAPEPGMTERAVDLLVDALRNQLFMQFVRIGDLPVVTPSMPGVGGIATLDYVNTQIAALRAEIDAQFVRIAGTSVAYTPPPGSGLAAATSDYVRSAQDILQIDTMQQFVRIG